MEQMLTVTAIGCPPPAAASSDIVAQTQTDRQSSLAPCTTMRRRSPSYELLAGIG